MGKRKILITDDELHIRELVTSALGKDQSLTNSYSQVCYFKGV
jgi:hypothetical protein